MVRNEIMLLTLLGRKRQVFALQSRRRQARVCCGGRVAAKFAVAAGCLCLDHPNLLIGGRRNVFDGEGVDNAQPQARQ